VDSHLVEQVCSQQLPGDIRAQHQDVLVLRGLLGAPDSSPQTVEGKPLRRCCRAGPAAPDG
jgi:hypothetical protein